ncbi:MAG: ATP-binding protein [bacterium]
MNFFPDPLSPEALKWRFDLDGSPPPGEESPNGEESPSTEKFIGQERAERALEFGLVMHGPDFNVFISGPPGTGRSTMCRSICERLARGRRVPDSIVYVQNYADPDRPLWLFFPTGLGRLFRDDMAALIVELRETIPKAFEDETHESRRKEVIDSAQEGQRLLYADLERRAREEGFALRSTQSGFSLIPLINGEPVTGETYDKLPEQEKEEINKKRLAFGEEITEFFKKVRPLEKNARSRLQELDKEIALTAVQGPADDLKEKYQDYKKVVAHLDAVQKHILDHLAPFRPSEEEPAGGLPSFLRKPQEEDPFRVYEVNVMVDNSDLDCAPVIYETNPTFNNLFGRIDRRAAFGTYSTDFTLVRAGSMISANGGYLILNTLDALTNPGVWPALKRAIRTRCVRIEDLGEMYGWTHGGIKPEPIPVNVKVILMGSPTLYYLLLRHDEDFGKLFKVKADFGATIERNEESLRDFRAFIEFHRKESDLLPFADGAVGRIIEESSRHVSHQGKLSARFSEMRELILEADHWARQSGAQEVSAEDVRRALDEQRFRADLLDERMREMIVEGSLMIDVEGAVVGQVNGLAVLDLGDYAFGKPSRITAQTFMGDKGVLNIERESKLSGNIHDKGVLILQGYLGGAYGQKRPLTLSASICFEQSYSGVDGDSASSTELYAIMSSLSGVPIKQGLAVTGSVNQRGEIQPIGGVNEKIEGFFEVCKEKGALTGEQGVLIPHQNVRNLMLREEVIAAVEEGRFRIYPIRTVEEGISVLTGVPAGERDPGTGEFPPDTIHGMVDAKLRAMFENLMRLRRRPGGEDEEEENAAPAPAEAPPAPDPPPPPPPPRRGRE